MADSILKLRVESSEYDAKLKKAAEGIRHLADVAHQGGGELTGLEKAELDYVKALGEMETRSRTAAGSVRELESTYKELKVIYDQLNDVEKADEGGKALAASLEQIKTRAQEARTQLENASKSLNDNGQEAQQSSSALDALASKFTINIDALKLFNIGLQAAKGALDVAKDAFFNNEEQLDEWGRIVESSQSLYEGFLNALNTGDISGFLSNIGRIEQAARDAYDALDALGTYNAFNQINIERTRTNMTESIADFRGGKGTKEGVKAAGDAYKKELADRQRLENDAYIAAVKEMAAKRGANAKDLIDALSGSYGHYQDLKNVQPSGTRTRYIPGLPGQAGRYEEFKVAQNDQERLGEALRHLNDTELQSLQALGAQAQRTGTEIAQVDKQLTRVLNAKQSGETTKSGKSGKSTKTEQTELQKNQAKITELTQQFVDINAEASRAGKPLTEEQKKQTEEIQKQIEALKQRNGLLNRFTEQAQGRLLSTDDMKRKAEIDMQVNTKQIEDLRRQLTEIEGVTIDPKSVTITATDEALPKLREIEGVTIDDKTMTVTAETADALRALQGIEGVTINPKAVTITATDEAMPKLREIEGVTINDKTMTVTAETADALQALQGIEGVTIDPKSVTITATDEAMPKLREIEGVTIDDKTMTVTAETADALRALQGIEGVTIEPKSVIITATDKAMPKLREIEGITIDDKTMTVTAETADALQALQGIEGVTIDPKSVTITATDEAMPKLREIEGVTIDDKTMTVTAETADSLRALQGIKGVTIDPKTIEVNANTSEAHQKIDDLKAKIAELEDKNINIKAFVDNVDRPLGEQQLNNTPGTLLKAPTTTVYEDGVMTEKAVPRGGLKLDDKAMKAVTKNLEKLQKKDEKKEDSLSKEIGDIAGGVSGMFSGLQQLGIELPEGLQGVLNGITGVTQILTSIMTIVSAIQAITAADSIIPFANGGVVRAAGGVVAGNTYSNDQIPALLNAGEVVLNRAQVGNLASQLQGGGMQNLNLTATIKGEQIRLVLNNNGRRTGRGEYVQSSNRV